MTKRMRSPCLVCQRYFVPKISLQIACSKKCRKSRNKFTAKKHYNHIEKIYQKLG